MLKGFSGILITVTNPMDINNYYLWKKTGMPREALHRLWRPARQRPVRYRAPARGRSMVCHLSLANTESTRCRPSPGLTEPVEVHGPGRDPIRAPGHQHGSDTGQGRHRLRPGIPHCPPHPDDRGRYAGNWQPAQRCLAGEYGLSGCSLGVPARVGRDGILAIEEWELDAWESGKMNEAGTLCIGISVDRWSPDGFASAIDPDACTSAPCPPEASDGPVLAINQVEYSNAPGGPLIHIFGRDAKGRAIRLEVTGFMPYFYVPADQAETVPLPSQATLETGTLYRSIRDEPLRRLYTQRPSDVRDVRDRYRHFEADIPFATRFMIDTGLTGGVSVSPQDSVDYHDIAAAEVDAPGPRPA